MRADFDAVGLGELHRLGHHVPVPTVLPTRSVADVKERHHARVVALHPLGESELQQDAQRVRNAQSCTRRSSRPCRS